MCLDSPDLPSVFSSSCAPAIYIYIYCIRPANSLPSNLFYKRFGPLGFATTF